MSTQTSLLDSLIKELEDVQLKTEQLSQEIEGIAKRAFILGYSQALEDAKAAAKGCPTNKDREQAKVELGLN